MVRTARFWRCLGGTLLGALPGALIFACGIPRVGIAVSVLGAFAGLLLAIPGVSIVRAMKLLVAVLINYNVPFSDRVYDWAHEVPEDTDTETKSFSLDLTEWVFATDVQHRRGWIVLVGLFAGFVVGSLVAGHDIRACHAGETGWILPMRNSKDPELAQGIMLVICFSVWTSSAVAMAAAPAYRRPLVMAVGLACLVVGAVAFASASATGPSPWVLVLAFSTIAAAVALLVATCVGRASET